MKNFKALISNIVAVLVGILTLVFLSQPYFNYAVESILGNGTTKGITGYAIIGNYFESEDAKAVVLALSCLIVAILAGIIILLAIFNMLTCTGVVKVKNIKVMNTVNVFISILIVIVGLIGLGCAWGICADSSFDASIGDFQLANGSYKFAWAIIVNAVLTFVSLGATFVARLCTKSAKAKKAKKSTRRKK